MGESYKTHFDQWKLRVLIIISFCLTVNLAKAKSTYLEYTFQRRDSTSLQITLSFTGDKSGTTLLHLPNEWAGQVMLYKCISKITVISKGSSVAATDKPYEYLIKSSPGSKVTLTYILSKDWTGPVKYPFYFRPVIAQDHFFFEGYSGIAYPDIADSVAVKCKISYVGFKKNTFFGNSFFAGKPSNVFITSSINNITNSFFCAGNYRSKIIDMAGHKIAMAITGQFTFTDEEAFSSISKIILKEREFWNDKGTPYFFTALMPLDDKSNYGGTAHYNSFFLFQSNSLKMSEGSLPLIAHEYFHNWIGQGLKMSEDTDKWFSEGFTDYFANKLLYESGIISRADFTKTINKYMREYYLSPYVGFDNKQLMGTSSEDNDLKQLPYRRGLTMAFMLDNKISEKGSALLDDLIRSLYQQSSPQMVFSEDLFNRLVVKYADTAVLAAIINANLGKNDQLTQNLLNSKGYKVGTTTISAIFDMGFDEKASEEAKKIKGLKPGSNAEKAGLVENMPITNKFSIWYGNTEKPLKVQVIRDGKTEWISYKPIATANIIIPQIVN